MKIRRIFAADTRKGIRKIREELGTDAVILANRKVNNGIEFIAAIDYDETVVHQAFSQFDKPKNNTSTLVNQKKMINSYGSIDNVHPLPSLKAEKKPTYQKDSVVNQTNYPVANKKSSGQKNKDYRKKLAMINAKMKINQMQKKPKKVAPPKPTVITKIIKTKPVIDMAAIANAQKPMIRNFQNELNELKGIIQTKFDRMAWENWAQQSPQRVNVMKRLSNIGLSSGFCKNIVTHIDKRLDHNKAWQKALGMWASKLSVTNDDIVSNGGVVALVGPTGVGKTTTIAKLAAKFSVRHGAKHVALVSCDFRVGAHDQLVRHGKMLGVPVLKASRRSELIDVLKRLRNKKLVLIDTVGCSPNDIKLINKLAAFSGQIPKIKHYLVMSVNTQMTGLNDIVSQYKKIKLSGCILTKLDEATSIGGALTVAARYKLPIAYLTNGQKVPEDIQVARIHQLISKAVAMPQKRQQRRQQQLRRKKKALKMAIPYPQHAMAVGM